MPPLPTDPDHGLRQRLLARVQRSVALHRDYTTVRREEGGWLVVAPGVVARRLWSGPTARVELLRLETGVPLLWPDDAQAQELLVLRGALDVQADGSGPGTLGLHEYCIRERNAGLGLHAALSGTEVYVRQRLAEPAQLPEPEARWWRLAQDRARLVRRDSRRWTTVSPGVEVFALWGDPEVVSMLVRFAPGAAVADHHHALDEDCLVLEGEMFLGDILLRPGDYQLAPAGGGHFGEMSDVGALFFFHGALDPVLTARPAA